MLRERIFELGAFVSGIAVAAGVAGVVHETAPSDPLNMQASLPLEATVAATYSPTPEQTIEPTPEAQWIYPSLFACTMYTQFPMNREPLSFQRYVTSSSDDPHLAEAELRGWSTLVDPYLTHEHPNLTYIQSTLTAQDQETIDRFDELKQLLRQNDYSIAEFDNQATPDGTGLTLGVYVGTCNPTNPLEDFSILTNLLDWVLQGGDQPVIPEATLPASRYQIGTPAQSA